MIKKKKENKEYRNIIYTEKRLISLINERKTNEIKKIISSIYKEGDTIDQTITYRSGNYAGIIKSNEVRISYPEDKRTGEKDTNIWVGNLGVFNTNSCKLAKIIKKC